MKILRILSLSLILSTLYSCSSTPVSYAPEGPIYCSPHALVYAGINVKAYNSRKWERDLPSLNDVRTAELGNSIITRIPVETTHYFVFDDNDTFKGDIYESSSMNMQRSVIETILSPEEILEVKGDSYCSDRRKKTSLQMIHAEILEKYSLHSDLSNFYKIRIDLGKGTKLKLVSESRTGKIFSFLSQKNKNWEFNKEHNRSWEYDSSFYGIFIPNEKELPIGFMVNRGVMFPLNFVASDLRSESSTDPYYDPDLMTQQLIYNGRTGESVKFLYREFKGDIARAPFQQNITYDLKIGEVIGFKGARFKILKADNVSLEYEVIKHFDRAYQGN